MNAADTAWMLVAAALVLIAWVALGYSLAFGVGSTWLGNLSRGEGHIR